jgi:hypothetical protein
LTKNGFPLIVFGLSDISGQLFPIAFMIVSHEETSDFSCFYSELNKLYQNIHGVSLSPDYILQDASRAEANGALAVFPSVKIRMCFFHVISNCKKREKLVDNFPQVAGEIKKMMLAYDYDEFSRIKNDIFAQWDTRGLHQFKEYFENQWVNGFFNTWQAYQTPIGYATSNNSAESMNSVIKRFTEHNAYDLIDFLKEILIKKLVTWAHKPKKFLTYRLPNAKTKSYSALLDVAKFAIDSRKEIATYRGNHKIYTIDLINKSCTCRYYYCYATCGHLYQASELYNVSLVKEYGNRPKSFVYRQNRGKSRDPGSINQLVAQNVALKKKMLSNNEKIKIINSDSIVELPNNVVLNKIQPTEIQTTFIN